MFWVFLLSVAVLVGVIAWGRRNNWRPPGPWPGNDTDAGAGD